jgi:hypothetical protein
MTSHTGRLYAAAFALLVFFVAWAAIAARPWAQAKADPRVAALAAREQALRRESVLVQKVVRQRWSTYRAQLRARKTQIAAAKRQLVTAAAAPPVSAAPATPSVRVVTLPPLTITRTS